MSCSTHDTPGTRIRRFFGEPLQYVMSAGLILLMVWLAVDMMSRLAGHEAGVWLYGLEGITLPLLAVAAVVLMWQSRSESAAKAGENRTTSNSLRVADGGTGLHHGAADRHAEHAVRTPVSQDGGSFPVRRR